MKRDKNSNVTPILEILTGAGIILFWVGFFTVGLAPEPAPDCYFAFEHSFPPPDIILSLALIASGMLLIKKRPAGVTLSLVSAGALVFLGTLDMSFNLQNGFYFVSPAELITNGFINLLCIGFGLAIIFRFWKK
ncbi:MAG: hypothetical protein JW984_02880 [Deltaproteobacteria bacterium]|uniref:DUF8058 domain-containing protein n=1 Tax=Candidatus Zymogenus saltonus TaxID=2844893 RepID=A0A9D8KCT5_9DELT|nr:hypothetical protein [Candidatus Zymogenus saltonus]